MSVRVTCRNLKLSAELNAMMLEKADHLRHYFDKVDHIEVILTAEKHRRSCEINVHAGHSRFAAFAENGSEGHAFEKALKAMERQIVDKKAKMVDRRRHGVNPAKKTNHSGKPVRIVLPEVNVTA